MRRLACCYGWSVLALTVALVVVRLVVGQGPTVALLAVGVLALAEAGLSALWIRTELALINDIRHHREATR